MKKEDFYKAVVAVKEIFTDEKVREELSKLSVDELIGCILDTYYKGDSIVKRVAFATVVATGCFFDYGGFSFALPATKDCLDSYEYVKKACRRHKPLCLTVVEDGEYVYHKVKFGC